MHEQKEKVYDLCVLSVCARLKEKMGEIEVYLPVCGMQALLNKRKEMKKEKSKEEEEEEGEDNV